jgi:hypothetical protein
VVDDLLAGRHLSSRVCPHCGHPPDDFADEETVVSDAGQKALASVPNIFDDLFAATSGRTELGGAGTR